MTSALGLPRLAVLRALGPAAFLAVPAPCRVLLGGPSLPTLGANLGQVLADGVRAHAGKDNQTGPGFKVDNRTGSGY